MMQSLSQWLKQRRSKSSKDDYSNSSLPESQQQPVRTQVADSAHAFPSEGRAVAVQTGALTVAAESHPPSSEASLAIPPHDFSHINLSQQKATHVALFDYSARTPQDLSFIKGDLLLVLHQDDSNWWEALSISSNREGFIPASFVARISSAEAESWFFGVVSRGEAERLLLQEGNFQGSFLIRCSETRKDEFSLSVRDSEDVKHYKIQPTAEGTVFITHKNPFENLQQLVLFYSLQRAGLCTLLIASCLKLTKPETVGLSYDTVNSWQIDQQQIELIRKLGSGHFGEVYKGVWNKTTPVAVKTLKPKGASKGIVRRTTSSSFMSEARVLQQLRHPKLIQLYGVCTTQQPYYIVTEYMRGGALLHYLRRRHLNLLQQLSICCQVCSGMMYLEDRNFIHRDLAARNVLVGEGLLCKVADFGLSRILQDSDEYEAQEGSRFPIKWTAPEALTSNRFTTKCDVWSFGVLVMEVVTGGEQPYSGLSNHQVMDLLSQGYRMPQPNQCHQHIYNITLRCWAGNPGNRPSFRQLFTELEDYYSFCISQFRQT